MKIDILTLFPEMFEALNYSIVKRAQEKGKIEIKAHNLRNWSIDDHGTVDDRPYGGGHGMILRVDVLDAAIKDLAKKNTKIVLLEASGKKFTHKVAESYSKLEHIILVAGHYEGIDHRIHEKVASEIISIGDYVLTGGELPAMVVIDAITRLIPKVIEKGSLKEESHSKPGYIEYPQYTRPDDYKGWKVPEVLLSGDHKKIASWREKKSKRAI